MSQKELVAAIARGDLLRAPTRSGSSSCACCANGPGYWDPGSWPRENVDDALRQFVTGKAAMFWHSSSRVKPITSDPLRTFEFGTFPFPTVTKESSPYATGIAAPAIGGFTGNGGEYVVDALTVKRGTRDAAIDWLMFITASQNYVPMANDLGAYAPGLVAAKGLDPALEPFVQSVQKGVFRIESYLRGLTVKYADQFYGVMQEYLAGRKDLAGACGEIQGYLEQAAADLAAEHGW